MRKFKRSIQATIDIILLIILIFCFIRWVCLSVAEEMGVYSEELTPEVVIELVLLVMVLVGIIISTYAIPPDFKYFIRTSDNWVIFEMSEDDHRIISKNFTISSKNKKKLLLDDGLSRISIAYNKEVLEFLKQITST